MKKIFFNIISVGKELSLWILYNVVFMITENFESSQKTMSVIN